ncbi:MAG: hypothetical protein INQ03_13680 [Candidatus Heimdallarchaeota archaeon]|nr:hypothetical protein [Candidatus Heimdallarchaeota archaeon]
MKYQRIYIVLILSMFTFPLTVHPQSQFSNQYYEFYIYVEQGSRQLESYALYIKQALAPLNIDVRIFGLPNNQLVGDVLGRGIRDFDLILTRWDDTIKSMHSPHKFNPLPNNPADRYTSSSYYGSSVLKLNSTEFQAWQAEDIGYEQSEIDTMFMLANQQEQPQEFQYLQDLNQFYFDNLLYELPLVIPLDVMAMHAGYDTDNDISWDDIGVLNARALGARWDQTSTIRVSNSSHLILPGKTPYAWNLDPYQSLENEMDALTEHTHVSLLTFDHNNAPHPMIAWNFIETEQSILINNSTEQLNGISFLLGNESYWSSTTDINGSQVPKHLVNANDFSLALDLYKLCVKSPTIELYQEKWVDAIYSYSVTTTLTENDTISILFNNSLESSEMLHYLGRVKPLPDHLLGGILNYNGMNATLDIDIPFNPWNSDEWNHWETKNGSSHVGPYQMVSMITNESYSFQAREDWWYPNENDVLKYYNSTDPEILAIEDEFDVNLNLWGGTNSYDQEAFFWNYLSNGEKPSNQTIISYSVKIVPDIVAQYLQFEDGLLDVFYPSAISSDLITEYQNNDLVAVRNISASINPVMLVFNLENAHLKSINVRKAISYALDREIFVNIHDDYAKPAFSFIDKEGIAANGVDYNYQLARELLGLEPYTTDISDIPTIVIDDVFSNIYNVFFLILLISFPFIVYKARGKKVKQFVELGDGVFVDLDEVQPSIEDDHDQIQGSPVSLRSRPAEKEYSKDFFKMPDSKVIPVETVHEIRQLVYRESTVSQEIKEQVINFNNSAIEEMKNGNYLQAQDILRKAIGMDPMNTSVLQNYAIVLTQLGSYIDAIELYDLILEINPSLRMVAMRRDELLSKTREEMYPLLSVYLINKFVQKVGVLSFKDLAYLLNTNEGDLQHFITHNSFDENLIFTEKEVRFKTEFGNSEYEDKQCEICKSKLYTNDNPRTECIHCGHSFHYKEYMQWIELKHSCPVCRTIIEWT